jgi:hypothetical protein
MECHIPINNTQNYIFMHSVESSVDTGINHCTFVPKSEAARNIIEFSPPLTEENLYECEGLETFSVVESAH